MKHNRNIIPLSGLLLWLLLVILFDRQDPAIYAATFLFSLTLTFLALAHSGPKFVEIKIDTNENA